MKCNFTKYREALVATTTAATQKEQINKTLELYKINSYMFHQPANYQDLKQKRL